VVPGLAVRNPEDHTTVFWLRQFGKCGKIAPPPWHAVSNQLLDYPIQAGN